MNIKKGLLGITVGLLGVGALAVGIDATAKTNKTIAKTSATQTVVDFDTATITRRFYFVINGYKEEWDTSGQELYVHCWGGTLEADQWSAKATKMYNDYGIDNQGLWYVDITAKGIGSAINAQVKRQGGSDAWSYTTPLAVKSLSQKSNDVMIIGSTADGSGNRSATLGTAGGKAGEVASFLNFVATCDGKNYNAGYNNGYNAYPQLKANFLDPSADEIRDYGDQVYVDGGTSYTLKDKIAKLESLYNENGWRVA